MDEYYTETIRRAIDLMKKLTNEMPKNILLNEYHYEEFSKSDEFTDEIDGVKIKEADLGDTNLYLERSKETYPYVVLIEAVINFELDTLLVPNTILITRHFYETYKDIFITDKEHYNNVLECVVSIVDNDQPGDIMCRYSAEYSDTIKYFKNKSDTNTDVIVIEKELFIDWLLDDEDALLDAMEYVEDHEEEIDKDFDYFCKECEFNNWLKRNGHEEELMKNTYEKALKEYEEYCLNHYCPSKLKQHNRKECKYKDYNRGLIDGKTPCKDCKIVFAIDYIMNHYAKFKEE